MRRSLPGLPFALLLPVLAGAQGDGCAAGSKSPAPDVAGTWDITYDDTLSVEVDIGGSVYDAELPAGGGVVTITHDGRPFSFDLDCARADIVCPSEGWPEEVFLSQRSTKYEHQMWVTLPVQTCSGQLVDPDPAACGAGTLNPECDAVCEGEITTELQEKWGVIGETGDSFRLYLGAGIATNGINCALLAWSVADATLESTGRGTEDWQATAMTNGLVEVGYAGGCLWAGQTDMDPEVEALVLGASIKFTTGFTGVRDGF